MYHLVLGDQQIFLFGDNHTQSSSSAAVPFMNWIETYSQKYKAPLHLYVENPAYNQAHKPIEQLSTIPERFKHSTISEFKRKHLQCLYEYEADSCSLSSQIETEAVDFRTIHVQDAEEVYECVCISNILTQMLDKCKELITKDATFLNTKQLATILSQLILQHNSEHCVQQVTSFVFEPIKTITNMLIKLPSIPSTQSTKRMISVLHEEYKRLQTSNLLHPMQAQHLVQICISSYTNDTNILPGWIENGKQLLYYLRFLLKMMKINTVEADVQPQTLAIIDEIASGYANGACGFWADAIHQFIASFGSIIMDLYVIMKILGDHLKLTNSAVLSGSTHMDLYAFVLLNVFQADVVQL